VVHADRRNCWICCGFIDKTGIGPKELNGPSLCFERVKLSTSFFGKAPTMKVERKSIEEIKVGDSAEWSRTVTEHDIKLFAEATGDFNPVHLDQSYAEKTFLRENRPWPSFPWLHLNGLGEHPARARDHLYLPRGQILAPVRIGDSITAKVEVMEVNPEKNRVRFKTICLNQEGKIVLDGAAWVMPPKKSDDGAGSLIHQAKSFEEGQCRRSS